MATKGPYDQDTWSPWLTKVIYKAPKAMSLQAFKMALLKKRLEEAKATAAAAASSKAVKEEAKEDIKAIRAELLAAKEREEQSKHADAYKEAKEEADDARKVGKRRAEQNGGVSGDDTRFWDGVGAVDRDEL